METINQSKVQFDKLMSLLEEKNEYIKDHYNKMFKIFNYIYLINHFKNRAETKHYFNSHFNIAFSLMIESTFLLYSKHEKASLLMLRSAQEMTLKSIIYQEREWIKSKKNDYTFDKLDFRFNENKKILVKDLELFLPKEYKEYYTELDRTLEIYKKLSGIVHSTNETMEFQMYRYFSSLLENINYTDKIIDIFIRTFKNLLTLICYMLRESIKKWDTYELNDILSVVIKKEKSRNNFIKKFKTVPTN
ncbi:hypothetical protein [Mammaliicoccus sciuri]|uniref:hypothetical protein n=1 Tax=Mammaliicoccus sciuri TaxID=1296 RepID=UPI001952FBB2|nr:hypothetical protein [Mammaliicoccus sciuri]